MSASESEAIVSPIEDGDVVVEDGDDVEEVQRRMAEEACRVNKLRSPRMASKWRLKIVRLLCLAGRYIIGTQGALRPRPPEFTLGALPPGSLA